MSSILEVGLARADITPEKPARMCGYPLLQMFEGSPEMGGYVGRNGESIGIADPLYAKVFVARLDAVQVAIVTLDLAMVDLEFTRSVREQVEARTGILAANVLLACSHTHSAPEVCTFWGGDNYADLQQYVREAIVAGVEKAASQMVEATIGYGSGDVSEFTINRRDPALDADSELSVIRLDAGGRPLGVLYNFACHPLILDYRNHLFSADFPGYASPVIENALGEGLLALFLNGAAGDINPVRFPYQPKQNVYDEMNKENYPVFWGSFDEVERFGMGVGGAVLRVAAGIETGACSGLGVATVPLTLPLQSRVQLERHCRFLNYSAEWTERLLETKAFNTEVQALRLGDAVLIAIPGELFSALGTGIKQNVHGLLPQIVSFANDDVRYILTEDCYAVNRYETTGTPLPAGSAALVEEAALAAVAELTG